MLANATQLRFHCWVASALIHILSMVPILVTPVNVEILVYLYQVTCLGLLTYHKYVQRPIEPEISLKELFLLHLTEKTTVIVVSCGNPA